MNLPEAFGNKFYYFGYASNLLEKRIHLQNPTAVRKCFGKLLDHELGFYTPSNNVSSLRWKGAPSTIIPNKGKHLYGAIWEIELTNLKTLDSQEGVDQAIYFPLSVPIVTETGDIITCRCYQLTSLPECINITDLNEKDNCYTPSCTYLKTIIKGAIETGLPEHYINALKKIRHNGNIVQELEDVLELKSINL